MWVCKKDRPNSYPDPNHANPNPNPTLTLMFLALPYPNPTLILMFLTLTLTLAIGSIAIHFLSTDDRLNSHSTVANAPDHRVYSHFLCFYLHLY